MRLSILGFMRSNRGTTAMEYGLIAGLIAIAAIAAFQSLAAANGRKWGYAESEIDAAMQKN